MKLYALFIKSLLLIDFSLIDPRWVDIINISSRGAEVNFDEFINLLPWHSLNSLPFVIGRALGCKDNEDLVKEKVLQRDHQGRTLLHDFCENCTATQFDSLIKMLNPIIPSNKLMHIEDKKGETLLHYAAKNANDVFITFCSLYEVALDFDLKKLPTPLDYLYERKNEAEAFQSFECFYHYSNTVKNYLYDRYNIVYDEKIDKVTLSKLFHIDKSLAKKDMWSAFCCLGPILHNPEADTFLKTMTVSVIKQIDWTFFLESERDSTPNILKEEVVTIHLSLGIILQECDLQIMKNHDIVVPEAINYFVSGCLLASSSYPKSQCEALKSFARLSALHPNVAKHKLIHFNPRLTDEPNLFSAFILSALIVYHNNFTFGEIGRGPKNLLAQEKIDPLITQIKQIMKDNDLDPADVTKNKIMMSLRSNDLALKELNAYPFIEVQFRIMTFPEQKRAI